jgi:hypothetical protein
MFDVFCQLVLFALFLLFVVLVGADRFKFICKVARELLEENGYGRSRSSHRKVEDGKDGDTKGSKSQKRKK